MATAGTVQLRIAKFGGPVSSKYEAYYNDGTAATEDWKAGEILYIHGGKLSRGDATQGNGQLGTAKVVATGSSNTIFGAAQQLFIALEDHDSSDEGASVKVSAQEIRQDTVFEIQVGASSTTAPTMANVTVGGTYGAYVDTAGRWLLDVDDSSTGIFVVIDKDSDTKWMKSETGVAGTAGSGRTVRVRLLDSVIK
jgi:hypothetical protein